MRYNFHLLKVVLTREDSFIQLVYYLCLNLTQLSRLECLLHYAWQLSVNSTHEFYIGFKLCMKATHAIRANMIFILVK